MLTQMLMRLVDCHGTITLMTCGHNAMTTAVGSGDAERESRLQEATVKVRSSHSSLTPRVTC